MQGVRLMNERQMEDEAHMIWVQGNQKRKRKRKRNRKKKRKK